MIYGKTHVQRIYLKNVLIDCYIQYLPLYMYMEHGHWHIHAIYYSYFDFRTLLTSDIPRIVKPWSFGCVKKVQVLYCLWVVW